MKPKANRVTRTRKNRSDLSQRHQPKNRAGKGRRLTPGRSAYATRKGGARDLIRHVNNARRLLEAVIQASKDTLIDVIGASAVTYFAYKELVAGTF
jgi:hypothetical protein